MWHVQKSRKEVVGMRKAFIIAILFAFAVPAMANGVSFSEQGVGLLLGVGSETRIVAGSVVFMDDTGCVLEPRSGVLQIEEGRRLVVCALITGATSTDRYAVEWTSSALVSRDNLQKARFEPARGWWFEYQPIQGISPLNLVLIDRKGKADFVRLIFKITHDRDPVRAYDQLFVQTVPKGIQGGKAPSLPSKDWQGAIDSLAKNQRATADYVNELEGRVTSLENYLKSVTQGPLRSDRQAGRRSVEIPIVFRDYFRSVHIIVTDLSGRTVCDEWKTESSTSVLLPGMGSYRVTIEVPGRGTCRGISLVVDEALMNDLPVAFTLRRLKG